MDATRRHFLEGLALAGLSVAAPGLAQTIPQRPLARVIVDNDFAGDPDGHVALAHQLLSPTTRTVLVTVSPLSRDLSPDDGVEAGQREVRELLSRLGGATVQVAGSAQAARAIVAEAMRDDPLPLFVTCGGPLTNVAAALRLEPRIATRITLVWIGGGNYPEGGWEYNLATDADAARHVVEATQVPLWQVPQGAYRQVQFSIAELGADMRPISAFTKWLYQQFTDPPAFVRLGGAWPMGDSPLVLLTAITSESSRYRDLPARRILPDFTYGTEIDGRSIRVFETLDARLTLADFLAKLRLHARR